MRTLIVIPARMNSTRLPGKVLLPWKGKPLLQHVYEACLKVKDAVTLIATDSQEVLDRFPGAAVPTGEHPNGTSRVAEVARSQTAVDLDWVINVQADEPMMTTDLIEDCLKWAKRFDERWSPEIVTAAKFAEPNESGVFVFTNKLQEALCFSRLRISNKRHIGIYLFRPDALQWVVEVKRSPAMELEQMPWLWHGKRIKVFPAFGYRGFGIDTPEDYQRLLNADAHKPLL